MRRQQQRDDGGRQRVRAEMLPNWGWTVLGMSSEGGGKQSYTNFRSIQVAWKFREIVEGHPKGQSNPKAEGASAAGGTIA